MNPKCARCDTTVYPVEKLSCLDKSWHKACFNCEVCHMVLTMKSYKGYNKLPYCKTHYPSTRVTAIADTPEQLGLAAQKMAESQVVYKKDLPSGHFQPVTMDRETAMAAQQPSEAFGYASQKPRKSSPVFSPSAPASQPQQPSFAPPQPRPSTPPTRSVKEFMAMMDYNAADDDEVSFIEGDIIVNASEIDDGWMQGRVKRTGEYGMLPSNHVEPV